MTYVLSKILIIILFIIFFLSILVKNQSEIEFNKCYFLKSVFSFRNQTHFQFKNSFLFS